MHIFDTASHILRKSVIEFFPILSTFLTQFEKINIKRAQYRETNAMHFLFSLLRIKDLYMFRALLAHPQDILRACYISWLHQSTDINTHTIYQVPLV
jgi:hypothetical protein